MVQHIWLVIFFGSASSNYPAAAGNQTRNPKIATVNVWQETEKNSLSEQLYGGASATLERVRDDKDKQTIRLMNNVEVFAIFCWDPVHVRGVCRDVEQARHKKLIPTYITADKDLAGKYSLYVFPAFAYLVTEEILEYKGEPRAQLILNWMHSVENTRPVNVSQHNFETFRTVHCVAPRLCLVLVFGDHFKQRFLNYWQQVTRLLHDNKPAITTAEFDAREPQSAILAQQRFFRVTNVRPGPYEDISRLQYVIVLLQDTRFRYLTSDKRVIHDYKRIREFVSKSVTTAEWFQMEPELSEAAYEYYKYERHFTRSINASHIIVGFAGGVGVIVLAISIFWGLKTSKIEHRSKSDKGI